METPVFNEISSSSSSDLIITAWGPVGFIYRSGDFASDFAFILDKINIPISDAPSFNWIRIPAFPAPVSLPRSAPFVGVFNAHHPGCLVLLRKGGGGIGAVYLERPLVKRHARPTPTSHGQWFRSSRFRARTRPRTLHVSEALWRRTYTRAASCRLWSPADPGSLRSTCLPR